MIKKTVKVQVEGGLDVRPVAVLVQIANQYDSEVYLENEKHKFNAKSIMGMMTLCTCEGDYVNVIANGVDEEKAIIHLENYLLGLDA
ncbi:MAG: HPr family phosphocarrier protein [Lachnospiraceae bacterium]